jgi:hypothetical protein
LIKTKIRLHRKPVPGECLNLDLKIGFYHLQFARGRFAVLEIPPVDSLKRL